MVVVGGGKGLGSEVGNLCESRHGVFASVGGNSTFTEVTQKFYGFH